MSSHVFVGKLRASSHATGLATLAALAALLVLQSYAFYAHFELSLGPRVILQPWLLQNGYLLYQNIPDEHSPLLYVLLAVLGRLFPIDGLTIAKVALVCLVDLSTLMTYWIGNKTIGWFGGLGALFFICWSSQLVSGKLWHETLLMPVYAAFLLYTPALKSYKSLAAMGLLGGLAILIKQHSVAVVGSLVLWNAFMVWRVRRPAAEILKQTGIISAAMMIPLALYVAGYCLQGGNLNDLAFWTIGFNFVSGYGALGAKLPTAGDLVWLVGLYFLVPVAIVDMIRLKRKQDARWMNYGWGLTLVLATSATAVPRFDFFHLQASLPVVAWLSTFTLYRILGLDRAPLRQPALARVALVLSLAAILIWAASAAIGYAPLVQGDSAPRIWEYSELVPLADQIREHVGHGDCIYIFPDDEATANLYYLLNCFPPKYWVMAYPWFMLDPIKDRLFSTFRNTQPRWLVYFPGRWDIEHQAADMNRYIQEHYRTEAQLSWFQGEAWLLKREP